MKCNHDLMNRVQSEYVFVIPKKPASYGQACAVLYFHQKSGVHVDRYRSVLPGRQLSPRTPALVQGLSCQYETVFTHIRGGRFEKHDMERGRMVSRRSHEGVHAVPQRQRHAGNGQSIRTVKDPFESEPCFPLPYVTCM